MMDRGGSMHMSYRSYGGGAAFLFKYPTPEEFPEKLHFSPNLTFLTIQAKMLSNLGPLQLIVDHVK